MAAARGSTGDILAILRDGTPRTKTELAELTGQARSTITRRLDELVEKGLVGEDETSRSSGGRPSTAYVFLGESQFVLCVDLGAHTSVVAITNLRAEVVASWKGALSFEAGPGLVVPELTTHFRDLLKSIGRTDADVVGIGIGIASAVDSGAGHVVSPSLSPAWDDFDLAGVMSEEFHCPAFVDNDANVLAIGEQRTHWPETQDLLYVQLGSGIGGGIITGGQLSRGADGVSGDLSHIYSPDAADILCRCGNVGCVVALAGGFALADRMTKMGFPAQSAADVVQVARQRNPDVSLMVRNAARALGGVLATCVALLNPEVIVLGGPMSELGEPLIAGVKEAIYGRALPYASRRLQVVLAKDSEMTAVIGAAHMVLESVLHPKEYRATFAGDA